MVVDCHSLWRVGYVLYLSDDACVVTDLKLLEFLCDEVLVVQRHNPISVTVNGAGDFIVQIPGMNIPINITFTSSHYKTEPVVKLHFVCVRRARQLAVTGLGKAEG